MYRIILIDDEPLILAGIASLINWEDHGCCGSYSRHVAKLP